MTRLDQHSYTIEILYHFTCGSCQKWWSYTHTPSELNMDLNFIDDEKFWCPHCGHQQKLKLKEGFPI
jgi:hypothetical protein|tara:strand:- start:28034 stop:28234 length:201 start_codon:yes stop_codon:yes gene_type:complete